VDLLLHGHEIVPQRGLDGPWGERTAGGPTEMVEPTDKPGRLPSLAGRAGLCALDVDLLMVALAPDLDSRFESLYGYLNDDVTRRRATIGLCLALNDVPSWSGFARDRFHSHSPLVANHLIEIDEPERPFLSRSLRVPDRVTSHLLGVDHTDPVVLPSVRECAPQPDDSAFSGLVAALDSGIRLVYLRERAGTSGVQLAAGALKGSGCSFLALDASCIGVDADLHRWANLAGREGLLADTGLIIGPIEAVVERSPAYMRTLSELPCPVVLCGRTAWEPRWTSRVPLLVDVPVPTSAVSIAHWRHNLGASAPDLVEEADFITQFVLSGEQVRRAVESARLAASYAQEPLGVGHLRNGARAQNGAGLERLARRVQSTVGWEDLVLAPATLSSLQELADRAGHRSQVLDEWGMRPGGGRGRGITALFAGDSGTGKTMSAEVVARHLGFDLYAVNLATVVDKYVGETEKNLERIFSEADEVNAVILFDEADALFGKRSEVRDANDRYANIEVAYLLQRMEAFDGLAILSTNLRANIDESFARRLDLIVDFPRPDETLRRVLWDRCLAPKVPRGADLDLDYCARAFELSGGNIRSVAISVAYAASANGRPVAMADIVAAVGREYRKLGRLVVASEFGEYFDLVGATP
jgi:hypothetical protein